MKKEVKNKIDKRQVFTKIMAGFLVLLMLLATCGTLIYALLG